MSMDTSEVTDNTGGDWDAQSQAGAPDQLLSPDPNHPDSGPLLIVPEGDDTESGFEGSPVGAALSVGGNPLLTAEVQNELLSRWTEVQVSFVGDPLKSVQAAEELIREITDTLAAAVEERQGQLAAGWNDESDTEGLRLALWQYRSFIGVILPK